MRRKTLCAAIAMVAGMIASYYLKDAAFVLYGIVTGGAALLPVLKSKRKFALCLAVFFVGGGLLMNHAMDAPDSCELGKAVGKEEKFVAIVREIEKVDEESYRICCDIDGENLLVSYYAPIEAYYNLCGAEIEFYAVIERPKKAGNPRTFDYRLYLETKKIYYTASIEGFQVLSKQGGLSAVKRLILEKKELMLSCFDSDTARGLLCGILFGDTGTLDQEVYKEFQRNGTAHILAVSGLHIGILYGLYKKLAGRRRSIFAAAVFVLFLLLYGSAALWAVSVKRAVFLIVLLLLGDFTNRRYDMITALAVAAMVILIRNPYALLGASFQMSFLAVLSIIFFGPVLEKKIGSSFGIMLSVQLGLLPYMTYTFNYISFSAFLSNIPVVFLVSLLVPLGLFGFLWSFAAGSLLQVQISVLSGLADMCVWVNGLFYGEAFSSMDVISPPLWAVALFYLLGFYLCSEHFQIYFGRKDCKNVLAPLIPILILVLIFYQGGKTPFDEASIVFVDVGQGDCVHMRTLEGENLLIDGGGSIRYNIGEKTLKPYLLKNGAWKVELAAATHLHTDHYLGIQQLAECFPVQEILTEGKLGQKIYINKEQWIEILWPVEQDPLVDDENKNSLIFMVHDRDLRILITGDLTEEGEMALVERYRGSDALQADILKVAHHGSAYSSCDAFLEAVNPSIAVISVGKNNYGHPSNMVIEKLTKKGIMVYRTDLSGAVGIINKKGRVSVCLKNQ